MPEARKPWKLVNMKVKHEVLRRIDEAAHALGLTRTDYIIRQSDPEHRDAKA